MNKGGKMDRATYDLLQTIFDIDDSGSNTNSPESQKDTWVQLMSGEVNAFRSDGTYGLFITVLEDIMRDFEYRTLAPVLSSAFALIRPISQNRVAQLLISLTEMPRNPDIPTAIAAQWLYEFRYLFSAYKAVRPQNQTIKIDPSMTLALGSEVASYASWRNLDVERRKGPDQLAEMMTGFQTQFDKQLLEAEQSINRFSANVIELQEKDEKLRRQIAHYEEILAAQSERAAAAEVIASQLGSRLLDTEENYAKFTAAIERKYAISATRDYWRKQATSSAIAFGISAALLICILIILPILAFIFHSQLQEIMESITTVPMRLLLFSSATQLAFAALNKLLLIILPLALLVWFVRLLVRFTLRSLALSDDAKLRQAMMDTFLRLDVDSDLSKEERNVMLSALYRPGPGQAPDAPDFPNVIELIDKIQRP
jgi:hypothetical protein